MKNIELILKFLGLIKFIPEEIQWAIFLLMTAATWNITLYNPFI